jgi:hypothetical protein
VLSQSAASGLANPTPDGFSSNIANSTPTASSTSATSSSTNFSATAPAVQVNGDNPAIIQIGATYNDLGATITGPQADLNLGIKTFLNGAQVSNIVLDTTQAATDTVDYVVTDQTGLTSTSTRTVIIQPTNDNQASTTSNAVNANTPPLATTTTTTASTTQ